MPDPRHLLDHDVACVKIASLRQFYGATYGNVLPSGAADKFGRSSGQLLETSKSVHVFPQNNFAGAANVRVQLNQR
jgi:hypothetical protein